MALGNDGIRPDALELRIRFVCGALVGAFLTAGTASINGSRSDLSLAFQAVAGGLVCGVLARQYGDRFWRGLRGWF